MQELLHAPLPQENPCSTTVAVYTQHTHTDKQVYLKNLQEFQGKLTAFICSTQYHILQTNYLGKKTPQQNKDEPGQALKGYYESRL